MTPGRIQTIYQGALLLLSHLIVDEDGCAVIVWKSRFRRNSLMTYNHQEKYVWQQIQKHRLTLKVPEKLLLCGLYVYYVVHICDFGMLRVKEAQNEEKESFLRSLLWKSKGT